MEKHTQFCVCVLTKEAAAAETYSSWCVAEMKKVAFDIAALCFVFSNSAPLFPEEPEVKLPTIPSKSAQFALKKHKNV